MKFSIMWANNAAMNRPMSRHTFRLRDLGHIFLTKKDAVHLDHVYILFTPLNNLTNAQFIPPDSRDLTLRGETMQLMVRTTPGVRHMFFTERSDDKVMGEFDQVDVTTKATTYSSSLSITPDVEGTEDYWCRTYRPIRDLPVIQDYEGDLTQLTIEFIWPIMLSNHRTVFQQIPDYRIYQVIVEFSIRFA